MRNRFAAACAALGTKMTTAADGALPSAGIDLWKEDRDGEGADMTTRGLDVAAVRRAVLPLGHPADLEPLLDRFGSARLVLLGEASHGTREFYRWRAELPGAW